MKNKIIFGSILAVAILLGVSLTSVVGYQSVDSNFKASPLFNVRSNRAIEKDSNDVSYDYIGKGIAIPFPYKENTAIKIQRIIEEIIDIDRASNKKFVDLIINTHQQEKQFNKNVYETINYLKQLNKIPVEIFEDSNIDPPTMTPSIYDCCTFYWEGGCLLSIYSPLNCFFYDLYRKIRTLRIKIKILISDIYDYFSWYPEC
jgi:hypothetical protein